MDMLIIYESKLLKFYLQTYMQKHFLFYFKEKSGQMLQNL